MWVYVGMSFFLGGGRGGSFCCFLLLDKFPIEKCIFPFFYSHPTVANTSTFELQMGFVANPGVGGRSINNTSCVPKLWKNAGEIKGKSRWEKARVEK